MGSYVLLFIGQGVGILLLPAVLLLLQVYSIYLLNLQSTDRFMNDMEYCISSVGTCDDSQAAHSAVAAATGDYICTESGVLCLYPLAEEFNGFDYYVYTNDAIKRIIEQADEQQNMYFPFLIPLVLVNSIALIIRLLLCKCENVCHPCRYQDRNVAAFVGMLFAIITGALCVSSKFAYRRFHDHDCAERNYPGHCRTLENNYFQLHSINYSQNILANSYPTCMPIFAGVITAGVIAWGAAIVVSFTLSLDAITYPETVRHLQNSQKSDYAHNLLSQLTRAHHTETNKEIKKVAECCAICLEGIDLCVWSGSNKEWPGQREMAPRIISSDNLENIFINNIDDADVELNSVPGLLHATNTGPVHHSAIILDCPCGHAFHYDCLHSWVATRWSTGNMRGQSSCPMCRQLLFATPATSHIIMTEIIENRGEDGDQHQQIIRLQQEHVLIS